MHNYLTFPSFFSIYEYFFRYWPQIAASLSRGNIFNQIDHTLIQAVVVVAKVVVQTKEKLLL